MEYSLESDSYYLKEGDEIILMADEIAIAFAYYSDEDLSTCIHKHGSYENVKKWYEDAIKKYNDAGLKEEAKSLRMISGKFPIEELNKIINNTGYLGVYLKRNGLNVWKMKVDELVKMKIEIFCIDGETTLSCEGDKQSCAEFLKKNDHEGSDIRLNDNGKILTDSETIYKYLLLI